MKTLKIMFFAMIMLFVFLVSSCSERNKDKLTALNSLSELYKTSFRGNKSGEKATNDAINILRYSSQIPQVRDSLGKMRMVVKILNGTTNAGVTIPGFSGLKLGKEESNLNVYYLETKVVIINGDTSVWGCGYSFHYLFKKVEKGISLDNIPSIAASAQLNTKKTQVLYSLQSYGMTGTILVPFFKPVVNRNFNVEGFGFMQSSLDGIHNIMANDELSKSVKYRPEELKFIKPFELMNE